MPYSERSRYPERLRKFRERTRPPLAVHRLGPRNESHSHRCQPARARKQRATASTHRLTCASARPLYFREMLYCATFLISSIYENSTHSLVNLSFVLASI